ncbi:unnamed protein product [Candidula unifasciata]|uniref:DNA excision repair protein ERCC-6-like n=1 Tax=Candidula unifasciata TaxID=100452 RepID=A0A8S3YRX0_9EUPU|nr:unnamed protein product [Candidula unifasciata]
MDIEDKVANISLHDEHRNSSSNMTRNSSAGSESDVQSESREKFMQLLTKARQLTEDGNIAGAVRLNEEALAIHFSDKLQRRIAKMKAFLADQEKADGDEDGDHEMKSLGNGFLLHTKLHEKLYRHQKEGVLWMWSLFLLGKGGILADDMGLGKTIQIIGFLAGLFDMNKIKSVMIVVPLSVLPNWLNEFNKWTPGINVMQFHGSSKKEKERALARVRTRGGVLMTTYGLVVTTKETFAFHLCCVWQEVTSRSGLQQEVTSRSGLQHEVTSRSRLQHEVTSRSGLQQEELWSLFDYVHQGSLLGTVRTFKMEFETPIIRARERDATAVEKKLGQEMAHTLKSIIQPYFLRRTKAELLMTKKSPLVALTVLKKICDHPRLLSTRACLQLGLDGDNFSEEDLEQPEAYESAATQIDKISDDVLMQESGKLQVLVSLVDSFKMGGHRTLIFSQSRKLLDIIQKVITNKGHKTARLDGTVTHLADRDKIVKKFQSDSSISVFLLTVQVGGVGLTITSADRVIIYDPSWNPATDAQAVDRVYRIGQVKNVIVYRLITCGTVEEKIYRRQVFKDSITRQTTGNNSNPYRYFTKMDLKELFTLDDPKFSKTQKQLENLHGNQRETDAELDEHIAFLHSMDIFGISDHDLMFKQKCARDDEDDDVEIIHGEEEVQNNARFIEHRVTKAQMLIAEESSGLIPYEERSKGRMKYPPTAKPSTVTGGFKPKPSSLFTQIKDKSRRALQTLSPAEVEQRTTRTPVANAKTLVTEELLISPDIHSPVVSLKKVPGRSAKAHSFSPSPVKSGLSFPKSSIISGDVTPRVNGSPQGGSKKSGGASCNTADLLNVRKAFALKATSTPQDFDKGSGIFVEETPDSDVRASRNRSNSSSISSSSSQNSMDITHASRKLSFVVADSDQSFNSSIGNSSFAAGELKPKTHKVSGVGSAMVGSPINPDHQSFPESADFHSGNVRRDFAAEGDGETNSADKLLNNPVLDTEHKMSTNDILLSPKNRCQNLDCHQESRNATTKRRSVCIQKAVIDESDDDVDDDDDDDNIKDVSLANDETEYSSDIEVMKAESDENDKENIPVHVINVGGRRRIVSDSESEETSFEVVESDEEGKPEPRSQGREDNSMEEEEGEVDEEQNERFQNLISVARAMYKQKNYPESLLYVEEALTIFVEPDLEQMAARIRMKIQEQQQ